MNKPLFFGLEIFSPWPEQFPQGRILSQEARHMTLLFMGEANWTTLSDALIRFPIPFFKVGASGVFDQCLFLPSDSSNVVAWHASFLTQATVITQYINALNTWAKQENLPFKTHDTFLPHVTIARKPFDQKEWRETFIKTPFITGNLHLYESQGNSQYIPLRTWDIDPAFEEIPHTADVAFLVRGETFEQLAIHAHLALCFLHPPLLSFIQWKEYRDLNELIYSLNQLISVVDTHQGVPIKAISYHGSIESTETTVEWEMIIDV